MTGPQLTIFAILAGTMLLFVWGRLRYDMVAIVALLAAIATGVVAPARAFAGFSDEIVIIVGSALVVSAAIERSGVVEAMIARLTAGMSRIGSQIMVLAGATALLSALVKNIGALAMLMPSALSLAKRSHGQPSRLLMPMSFASLLGGLARTGFAELAGAAFTGSISVSGNGLYADAASNKVRVNTSTVSGWDLTVGTGGILAEGASRQAPLHERGPDRPDRPQAETRRRIPLRHRPSGLCPLGDDGDGPITRF